MINVDNAVEVAERINDMTPLRAFMATGGWIHNLADPPLVKGETLIREIPESWWVELCEILGVVDCGDEDPREMGWVDDKGRP